MYEPPQQPPQQPPQGPQQVPYGSLQPPYGQRPTQPPQPAQPHRQRTGKGRGAGMLALGLALGFVGGCFAGLAGADEPTMDPAAVPTVTVQAQAKPAQVEPAPTVTVTSRVTVTAKPAGPSGEINEGTWVVGTEIKPGTYKTDNAEGLCYWARLSGTTGDLDEIIANENETGPATVTIQKTDKAFKSQYCGTWRRVS